MTTDSSPQKVSAENLFEPNDVLNLTPTRGFTQPIAAVSFVASRQSIETPWRDVLSVAISAATDFLETSSFRERGWLFFGASDIWRKPSAVIKHKGFWGANKDIAETQLQNSSPEIEFTYDSKVRYAVCAELPRETHMVFGEWIRSTQSGLMLLESSVEKQTEFDVKRYFAIAFANGDSDVDWSRAVANFCASGSILVRFSGAFDDPDAAVDLMYDPRCVKLT